MLSNASVPPAAPSPSRCRRTMESLVSFYRVSTDRQERSGLGLDAQKEVVWQRLNGGRWQLTAEFVEIESGGRAKSPQLDAALAACMKHKAKSGAPLAV
jgi:DNA invertase Pin-like site-specific DNA recombinase